MAYRTFSDSAGVDWTVYAVVPRADERRAEDRRRDDGDIGTEDRRQEDRRVTVGPLPSLLRSGWLCFEKGDDRRRLQPIPENWAAMSDSQLSELLDRAQVVVRRSVRSRA